MKTNQRGESEIFGLSLMMVVLLAVIVFGLFKCYGGQREALREAEAFSKDIPGVTKVTCMGTDSDQDGYISCTLFRKDQDPIGIECAGAFTTNDGCRLQKVNR